MVKFSLFEGRHELPANEGALCSAFDFESFSAVKTDLWSAALESLKKGQDITLYVTGLTPALTEFLGEARALYEELSFINGMDCAYSELGHYVDSVPIMGSLYLAHYNRDCGEYIMQKFA